MKHFLLAMATLWCVAGTFSLFAADNNKWKPLFGKNLENANYNPEVWSETDGVLGAVKDESIWTKDEYENFELDLDFKTDVGTNSGVVVYCTDTKDWIPNSVEIQIADDHCEKWGNGKPYEKCGAIYGHLGAVQDKVVKKPGEWNHMRIKCAGQHIMVILNGKKVTEMDMSKWTSGTKNPDGSDIPSWLPKPFLECPGDKVELTINRNGSTKKFTVELRNAQGSTKVVKGGDSAEVMGAAFKALNDEQKRKLGVSYGIEVTGLTSGKLKDAGIKKGFIIMIVNNQKISAPEDLEKIVESILQGRTEDQGLFIKGFYPNGRTKYYAIDLAE